MTGSALVLADRSRKALHRAYIAAYNAGQQDVAAAMEAYDAAVAGDVANTEFDDDFSGYNDPYDDEDMGAYDDPYAPEPGAESQDDPFPDEDYSDEDDEDAQLEMHNEEMAATVDARLADHSQYLQRTAAEMVGGAETEESLSRTVDNNVASVNPLYEFGFGAAVAVVAASLVRSTPGWEGGSVTTATWHAEDDPATCVDCKALDGVVWVGDAPHPYPGESPFGGPRRCGPNCRCELWYDIVPADQPIPGAVLDDSYAGDALAGPDWTRPEFMATLHNPTSAVNSLDLGKLLQLREIARTEHADLVRMSTDELLDLREAADLGAFSTQELWALRGVLAKFSPDQPRDDHGRWTAGSQSAATDEFAEMPLPVDYGKPLDSSEAELRLAVEMWTEESAEDIRHALAKGTDSPGLHRRKELGQALVRAANAAPPTTAPLYRGIGLGDSAYGRFQKTFKEGATVDLNLSGWTPDSKTAAGFAEDKYGTIPETALDFAGQVEHPVMFTLEPGAHTLDVTDRAPGWQQFAQEHLTAGRFLVTGFEHGADIGMPGDVVHLRQVGTLMPDQLVGTKVEH